MIDKIIIPLDGRKVGDVTGSRVTTGISWESLRGVLSAAYFKIREDEVIAGFESNERGLTAIIGKKNYRP